MDYGDDALRWPIVERPRDRRTVSVRKVALYCLAILSIVTAVIHFAVSGEHFQEYWVFGVFMLVTAWLQLMWTVGAIVRPSRLLLWGGVVLNTGIIGVYIVTRTVGDVIGPTPHDVEPFGFGDGLCTVLEAVVAVGCAWLLVSKVDRQIRRDSLFLAPALTGAGSAILLSIALVAGGPEMVMGGDDAMTAAPAAAVQTAANSHSSTHMQGMQMSGGVKATIRLADNSPAGAITMPNPNMQMATGMKMATGPCTSTPTKAQQQATVRLVNRSWKAAQKFRNLAAAKAAGYVPITPTGFPVVHYANAASLTATINGGRIIKPRDPQSLVYANTPKGAVLVATMYITSPLNGATPQPGGCLTQWHVHTNLCINGITVVGLVSSASPNCPAGSKNYVTPPMMHVWYVPIPGGPTAVDAPDAQVVRAAERVSAPANGTA
jgi:hypothetical protein